ncbi:EF-P beta-lysylation protein EpmB [Gallibacterium anatis]|uniref:EF-P beta-lysylation protein EpmB n=1 Tax=Gallibacterium anatis TaxID=750 RepID=UPI0005319C2D|nr:EF-P beta-lysylation protein EpmB [Gallibacterium anatis]KGQ24091.1 lysine 2,3-aminomutase [Gallibacterium anatis]KGQ28808.1 lysine 2,3-aminomutase [Gallibacterium anatis]
MIKQNIKFGEDSDWTKYLATAVSDPIQLVKLLNLPLEPYQQHLAARRLFAMRVPMPFINKMEKGNANDPLFLQVMTDAAEFLQTPGFVKDPLQEQDNAIPNLLHKYHNRVLLMVKGGCAVNCRYCFRRHFPYENNPGNKTNWHKALDYIAQHSEIEEVIFSGGDPLMAKDRELAWLLEQLNQIPHLKTVRIHSRLPVVIPQRITPELCRLLADSPLNKVLVLHINHANEIDELLSKQLQPLKQAGVTLLNQSVLLKGINDDAHILKALNDKLFATGILPYYLHLLDKVEGASHFWIDDERALAIYRQLITLSSGYLVPKLAREIAGEKSKTWYS